MTKKMTKREMYTALMTAAETQDFSEINLTELKDFAENEIALLDRRAEKAKETAAKKAVEGDELRDIVQSVLTDEYQTIADVTAQIEGDEITVAKVTYRLNALNKAGIADKAEVAVEVPGGKERRVMAYRLAQA